MLPKKILQKLLYALCRMGVPHSMWQPGKVTLIVRELLSSGAVVDLANKVRVSDTKLMCL